MPIQVTLQAREDKSLPVSVLADGYVSKHWWPELRLDLSLEGIAADFYLFYAMKDASPYLQEKFNDYAQVVAKQLAIYIDAACGGELRHKNFAGLLKTEGRSIARRDWRRKRQAQGINLLQSGRDCFNKTHWAGPYGGKRWGAIADVLIRHLTGELEPFLFVDLALALQHNTGTVFNKLHNYWRMSGLMQVLDANLHENWGVLIQYASPWAQYLFLNWYTEEDELEIVGIDYSRPRVIQDSTNGGLLGARVQVRQTARAKTVRGKEGTVVKLPNDHSAQVVIGQETKWMSLKNLQVLETITPAVTREYITEV